jgi:hypothetical protein
VQEALAGLVGLNPFAVENELGDGALAGMGDDFLRCAGGALDVDFSEGDRVGVEEALGLAAVAAPVGGIDEKLHLLIVADVKALRKLVR